MIILGIDPGTVSGWARIRLLPTGPIEIVSHGQIEGATGMCEILAAAPGHLLMVEGQWLPSDAGKGQAHRAHAADTIGLAVRAGMWLGAGAALGWETCSQVQPQIWRRDILGRRPAPANRAGWKVWALAEVKLRYGIELPKSRDHQAEAILIATWAAGMMRLRPMAKAGADPERNDYAEKP